MPTTIVSGGNELLNPVALLKDQLGIKPGQIIGDFGCGGAGYFAIASARMVGERGQVYAVDIVKNVLTNVDGKAKLQGLYNIKTIWSDLEVYGAMAIPEQSVDHGLLINILFQSKKHGEMLREVTRTMKQGGRLLIVDWNDIAVPFGPPMADRVKLEYVRDLVPQFGYQEEKVFEAGQYHYGIVFVKT